MEDNVIPFHPLTKLLTVVNPIFYDYGFTLLQLVCIVVAAVSVIIILFTVCLGRFCLKRTTLYAVVFCVAAVLIALNISAYNHLSVNQIIINDELYATTFDSSNYDDFSTETFGKIVIGKDEKASWFVEEDTGRILILRGCNVAASTKLPFTPYAPSYLSHYTQQLTTEDTKEDKHEIVSFFEHKYVSFVGRPFKLSEADNHWQKLHAIGFTFVRFLITWEAVEHEGPGIYDTQYLSYLRAIIRKANKYGINVYIDPHQDVWSRFSGGDGAPGWTLDVAGFDVSHIHSSGAAILHQFYNKDTKDNEEDATNAENDNIFPRMVWGSNYGRLAAATMFTLFFAGNDFAPNRTVNSVPIQDFLQSHFINAMKQVAITLKDEVNVVGYDTMNEPSNGFVSTTDLTVNKWPIHVGTVMTPIQAIYVGAGYPQTVDIYDAVMQYNKTAVINKDKISAWRADSECVWKQHGVYTIDANNNPTILKPHYFAQKPDGSAIHFGNDYLAPFYKQFIKAINSVDEDAIVFIENHLHFEADHVHQDWDLKLNGNLAFAPHWYDAATLFSKAFSPWLTYDLAGKRFVYGKENIVQAFTSSMNHRKIPAKHISKDGSVVATIIGEVGIPFDIDRDDDNRPKAFTTNDYSLQILAADSTLQALELSLSSFSWWNYTPDNNYKRGDHWNDEDLSIFSTNVPNSSNNSNNNLLSGFRALPAISRPYARKVAGIPTYQRFQPLTATRRFEFKFTSLSSISLEAATEIFLPTYQYPPTTAHETAGFQVTVSDGTYEYNAKLQRLLYYVANNADGKEHSISIEKVIQK